MIFYIAAYIVLAFLSCFTALVIAKYNDFDHEGTVLYSVGTLLAWPIVLTVTAVVFLVMGMSSLADQTAAQMKRRNK